MFRTAARPALALAVALAACGGSSSSPDAAHATDAPPGAVDAPPGTADAPPGAADAAPGGVSSVHTLYLNFEGQALTPGTDNPAGNTSSLLAAPFTAPKYLAGDAQRATKIAAIVAEVTTILAPYDVTITTTRPASGAYDMIVAGGTPQAAGFQQGVGSVNPEDCTATGQHVDLLFDTGHTQHDAARLIISMLGTSRTVPQADVAADCMCYSSNTCAPLTAACTIGGANTKTYAAGICTSSGATMNEDGEWKRVFGAHP